MFVSVVPDLMNNENPLLTDVGIIFNFPRNKKENKINENGVTKVSYYCNQ